MITTILKKQLQQEEIMLKISKFITILVVFFSISNLAQAKQTLYFPKNDLGWEGFDIDYIAYNKLGEKTSNSEFDRRIKAQIVKFKSHHEGRIETAKNLDDQLQAECDYSADAHKLLSVYLSRYPKLLQQPEAKPIFFQFLEYLDHFEVNNSKCKTLD